MRSTACRPRRIVSGLCNLQVHRRANRTGLAGWPFGSGGDASWNPFKPTARLEAMPIVDVSFRITGTRVPRDHGYPLYAAITSALPELHATPWLGIHPISSDRAGDDLMLRRSSELRLRVPSERIGSVIALAGAVLDVAGCRLRLGIPSIWPLKPSTAVDARLCVIKVTRPPMRSNPDIGRDVLDNEMMAERYNHELSRQLDALGVKADLSLRGRRSLTIKGRRVLGFSVRLTGLTAADSLCIQEHGLGGRRAFGCGIFRPTRGG